MGGQGGLQKKWEWPRREALEIKASPLVRAFWRKTDIDLTMASVKLCWELAPRALYHQRDNSPTTHIISYLDELAVRMMGAFSPVMVCGKVRACSYTLGNVVRQYASSLLGSYVQWEYYAVVIQM